MIQVCGERVLSGNRMKRKRLSDQKQAVKDVKSVEKNAQESYKKNNKKRHK